MFKTVDFDFNRHTTIKIKESLVQDFAKANGFEKVCGSQSIYLVNGTLTAICAYSKSFEARQIPINITQVICYNAEADQWRLFRGSEIVKGKATRRTAKYSAPCVQAKLTGGEVL